MELFSRELVLKKLAIAFPDSAEAEQALNALDYYGQGPNEPCVNGVHLAIIKLSEGNLWRLRDLVGKARRDFRDVLYPAQAPETFRHLIGHPPSLWNELRPKYKKLTPAKEAARSKREQKQWNDWLTS